MGDRAAVYISGEWVVEISAAGVNKATALAELCEERGIDADEVIAFGDHQNDVPMLAWAGHGVAVENAHPDAIAVADEDGARVLRRGRGRAACSSDSR